MKVYFAGPLFNLAELDFNRKLISLLKRKNPEITFFIPQEESKRIENSNNFFLKMFNFCINKIDEADVILAVLDGADADSGTCFEVGYAFHARKFIIGIRTDIRALEENGLNLMLSRSVNHFIRTNKDVESISDEIIIVLNQYDKKYYDEKRNVKS